MALAFLEEIKTNESLRSIPVVVLSANDRKNRELGYPFVIDWIKKPFEPRQIKKAIGNALRKHEHDAPVTVLIVEDDDATRLVLRQSIRRTRC